MTRCQIPPPGWICTRKATHKGPCAAHPEAEFYRAALEKIAGMLEDPEEVDLNVAIAMVEIARKALGR